MIFINTTMISSLSTLFPILSLVFASLPLSYATSSIPPQSTVPHHLWAKLNSTVNGRLIRSRPSAAVCHDPEYDTELCAVAQGNWKNSSWRTAQPGAYSALVWELGDDECFMASERTEHCGQGRVAQYTVNATGVEDIQTAVKFARKHRLQLVVKNTGHDHLGRSSVYDTSSKRPSLAIWTHNILGQTWYDAFVPTLAPPGTKGIPAVTLAAGEQWAQVYDGANTHKRIVVGGMARTVGAAGGYVLGGGHSAFSHKYGLAADNLLEATIVTAAGEHKTLNPYTDPDYFWAIRGGGGSAWGVLTSVTYKTHPEPSGIQTVFAQVNFTRVEAYRTVMRTALTVLPNITDAGYTGYATTDSKSGSIGFIFLQPDGTSEIMERVFAPWVELMSSSGEQSGYTAIVGNLTFGSWKEYTEALLTDPNIATNVQDASRFLPDEVLLEKTDALIDVIMKYGGQMAAGFNFIGKVNPAERDKTAVHPSWDISNGVFSLGIDWADNSSILEKHAKIQLLVDVSNSLADLVGPNVGTYVNEANPYETEWRNAFWGPNEDRLTRLKREIDPDQLFVCNRCIGNVSFREQNGVILPIDTHSGNPRSSTGV